MRVTISTLAFLFLATLSFAQSGTIRGNVYDAETGEPIIYGTVRLADTDFGTNTDDKGFFSIGNLPGGTYTVIASYVGYDSTSAVVNLPAGSIKYQRLELGSNAVDLTTVNVSARREKSRSDVQVSKITVTAKEVRSLPSTGGEADIAQYLTVLPGVVVSGDQGGQLYIRGGAPIQNKILLDGMIIYNPFHSIGFFSVFETEAIRSVDVLTGGFNAEYGGRISAIVDINTREGNKKRLSGLVSAGPFQAKAIVEGPIKAQEGNSGSTTFLLTGKRSYIQETSKSLYEYAVDTTFFNFAADDTTSLEGVGLPYEYTDIYGKLSFNGANGSQFNLFGFNFTDRFKLGGIVNLEWDAFGAGTNFTLIPPNSNVVIDGTVSYSKYDISLAERDDAPRSSGINNYSAALNFTYFGLKNQVKYGLEFTGFNTDFAFRNQFMQDFVQEDFTTELAAYVKYKGTFGPLIIEPGLRMQFFASQSDLQIEPRIGIKYNATPSLRFKLAGGKYSQNLISTVNDQDVVNFFVGFLAGPEETIYEPGTQKAVDTRLQTATHAVAGIELDLSTKVTANIEGYWKDFTQLIEINRNKLSALEPDFVTETGEAYGGDISIRYEGRKANLWATYSLGYVNRFDGEQTYPTSFDRRHNVNLLGTYVWGANNDWELGLRWNMGSGFPFTQTQGFYQQVDFEDILQTDVLTGNYPVGTLLSGTRNGGRLPYYHRLDASLKRYFKLSRHAQLELTLGVTNVYNRENVFFVDRLTNSRVNQLPILPSINVAIHF